MNSREHENVSLKTNRGKSRVISSRFLSPSPSSSSSPIRRNSTSNSSANNFHIGLKKHDPLSRIPNQSHGRPQVDTKENCKPSPWINDDEDNNIILPGRFSVDECALHRSSSRNSSSSLLYHNDESDSELSDVSSFASSRSHKPGFRVSSKYLHDASKGCTNNNVRLQQGSQSFRRTNSAARYGGSSTMSQWAMSPGRSLETPHHQASSSLKPPRDKGLGKLINLGFDFFRSKKKPSPLEPKIEAAHQLKLLNNRLVQWRFVNARASAANNNVAPRAKKQLLCAWDALTKLQNLVLQERINLQKKKLEMKLAHVLLSQVKYLEAWEDMGAEHFSSISMTTQAMHSLLSRVPLREGAKVNIESAVTIFQRGEAVSDAIISTVNSFAPTIEDIVPLASQLAEVLAQEKLMLEECHDLMRMISELEMEERSLKCSLMIQQKKTLDTKLAQD